MKSYLKGVKNFEMCQVWGTPFDFSKEPFH